MTKEEIFKLAERAGFYLSALDPECGRIWWSDECSLDDELLRFAALVAVAERDRIADEAKHIIKRAEARGAAAEREACARVCETEGIGAKYQGDVYAVAIRARGEK